MLAHARRKGYLVWLGAAATVALSWGSYTFSVQGRGSEVIPLQLCVSPEPGVASSAAELATRVMSAAASLGPSHDRTLAQARAAGDTGANVPFLRPIVEPGCPGGYYSPTLTRLKMGLPVRGSEAPPEGREFNIFVFVVSETTADANMAGLGYARTPYEFSCAEHVCQEVTTALFVTAATAADPALLFKAVEAAAGLQEGYADGHPPSER